MIEKENKKKGVPTPDPVLCPICEIIVTWVQNQLKRKDTKEDVLNHVNEVGYFESLGFVMCPKFLS